MEFFTNPSILNVGDLVAGPSALVEIPRLIPRRADMTEEILQKECTDRSIQLYEIVSIVKWRFLFFREHHAKLRRLSDGKIFFVNLDPPPLDPFSGSREREEDLRLNWARLAEMAVLCRGAAPELK